MSPTVSPVVMAHPSRRRFVDQLLGWLDRPAEVVFDRRNDRWDTGRRAWLAVDRTADFGLVIQDDTIPCRDLVAGVEKALTFLPEPGVSPLCLYCGRAQPYGQLITQLVASTTAETSWLTMSQLHWGPGIVLPTHLIGDMLAFCDRKTDIPNYDRRISRWCQHRGLTVWYPWPSLVEHRGVRENPSLVPGRTGDRRAHRFLGADVSALDQRWDGEVVGIPSSGAGFDGHRMWRVVGACAQASIATDNGTVRARQYFFKGSILPADVPVEDLRHLWSVGLIEPVPDPQPAPAPAPAPVEAA